MTPLCATDFGAFFAGVNSGRAPFAWQARLAAHVIETGCWPDRIDAPTGAGKSSVIDVHAFVVACMTIGQAPQLPRRLVVTVDRRALVDAHAERANALAGTLADALAEDGAPSVVREVAAALAGLRSMGGEGLRPLGVAVLRGGLRPSRGWLDDPLACQVIAATPDMWGSRLLFGGYGSTRTARAREAGLLSFDSVVVLDEAHLNRQLLDTARRVNWLVGVGASDLGVRPLQVTAMSATPIGQDVTSVGVRDEDLATDSTLSERLRTAKPVRLVPCDAWPATRASAGKVADALVAEVLAALSQHGGTVGCVVNTVQLATQVTARLVRSASPGSPSSHGDDPVRVRQIVGRMRPWELDRLRAEHPGLFRLGGDPSLDVVVATQTVEVGVDMDLSALVTELAPGSALAQRAGRVNRSGARPSGPVTVVVPSDLRTLAKPVGPYRPDELAAGLEWLGRRERDGEGLSPWAIHPPAGGDAPPAAQLRRAVLQRVEAWDVEAWAASSEPQFAEPDLDLWLADDLEGDHLAAVVVRQGLPVDDLAALVLVRAAPPLAHERAPVRLGELRAILAPDPAQKAPRLRRAFVVRADGVHVLGHSELANWRPWPEDVLVVDADVRIFTSQVVSVTGEETLGDVSERALSIEPGARAVRLHVGSPALADEPNGGQMLIDELRELGRQRPLEADDADLSGIRDVLSEWCRARDARVNGQPAAAESRNLLLALLELEGSDRADVLTANPSDVDFWVVVTGTTDRPSDEQVRQAWTPRRKAVDLETHAQAVGERARDLARSLRLPLRLTVVLERAGLLHDEGKKDHRFQRSLRFRSGDLSDRVLAKSGMASLALIRRARAESGLPPGWRHEQVSAAHAWEQCGSLESADRDLVTRLVGTSHGYGRSAFEHTAATLTSAEDAPVASAPLFDAAGWEALIDRTHRSWGYWGCAYLEALLRAADGEVSRRGS